MNYILAAILSNISYALADTFNGVATRKNSAIKLAVWVVILGLIIFTLPMLIFFQDELGRLTAMNTALILGLGLIVSLGYLSFVTGMEKGSVTLTGVIGGSFPAVTTVVALLFLGESINAGQGIAVIVILAGVVLTSMHGNIKTVFKDIRGSALMYAFGAFFLWGVYFALIRIPVERVGWFLPQYGSIVVSLPLYLFIAHRKKEPNLSRVPNALGVLVLIAILQVVGSMSFNYAISRGATSIVAPIAGSSPAVFVLLAYFIFKEKLNNYQKVGIATAIIGIVSLSILS